MEQKSSSFFFFFLDALELSWAKSDLLRFKSKSYASCRNPTAVFYFFRCRKDFLKFYFMWLFTPLTFKEMMFSFPIVYKNFAFPANGKENFFPNPPPARVVLCYTRFHTLLVNTFWLQEGGEYNWISDICNFLLQINTSDPVIKVQTKHKQNNLFLWPSEIFLEKVLPKIRVFCKIDKLRVSPGQQQYFRKAKQLEH